MQRLLYTAPPYAFCFNGNRFLQGNAQERMGSSAAAAAAAAAEHDYEDFNRRRMTSRAGPLSPNRGRYSSLRLVLVF